MLFRSFFQQKKPAAPILNHRPKYCSLRTARDLNICSNSFKFNLPSMKEPLQKFSLGRIREFVQWQTPVVLLARRPEGCPKSGRFLRGTGWEHWKWNIWIRFRYFHPDSAWQSSAFPCIFPRADQGSDQPNGKAHTRAPSNPPGREVLIPAPPCQRWHRSHLRDGLRCPLAKLFHTFRISGFH